MRPPNVNFRTLDLNLLKVFDMVMVERHVTRAADRLAMTQPAVSNALRRLRDATQQELFVAAPGGVVPTRQAEALWPTVRAALETLRDTFEPQPFDAGTDTRTFTVAMADATAALFVPVLADALEREQSRVALQIAPLTTRDPRGLLERGQVDAAVGYFPAVAATLAARDAATPVRREALYRCGYVCAMRAAHPLARKQVLTLDDYCSARHLRVNFAGRPSGFVDDALERLGRQRQVAITVSQFAIAGSVVQRSDLLTVLPRSFVPAIDGSGGAPDGQGGTADSSLAVRPLPFEMPGIEVDLLWHARHEHDAAQRWLRETIVRSAQTVAVTYAPPAPARAA